MTLAFTIEDALTDPQLLGAALGQIKSWSTWLATLKAAFGLKLNRTERRAFASVAGSRKPPRRMARELWCVIGRRSGKSRMAAALAVFLAVFVDHSARLSKGEIGYVLVLAPTVSQARLIFNYARAFIEASPILRQEIVSVLSDEIRLKGNIVIGVHPCSYRSVRGRTLIACVFDEAGYWRDADSALPDLEAYRAVLPALSTTGGMLIGVSTPYRRTGLLHQKHKDHYGQDDDDVLVVQGASLTFNPTLSRKMIAVHTKADPEAASAEWDAQFRADITALLDDEIIELAIDHDRPPELPPMPGMNYRAFVDMSGRSA